MNITNIIITKTHDRQNLVQNNVNKSTEADFYNIFQVFETAVHFLRSLIPNTTTVSFDDVILSG